MTMSVAQAATQLDSRGLLKRHKRDDGELVVDYVREQLGRPPHPDLAAFYMERVDSIVDFTAIAPSWNDWVGWRPEFDTSLMHVGAVPILNDGCGNLFGVDLLSGDAAPAVYFFDHERGFEKPQYAAGSSIAAFLLLAAEHDLAFHERRPAGWELAIDPDLGKCPRAPPIWLTG